MKYHLYYDFSDYRDNDKCEAYIELPNSVLLSASANTFEEAKIKVINRAKTIPPDEEIEI